MATRDGTCFAPGFWTGNGREKMEKRGDGNWGRKTGKWHGIGCQFPVFPSTSRFLSDQCRFKTMKQIIVATVLLTNPYYIPTSIIQFCSRSPWPSPMHASSCRNIVRSHFMSSSLSMHGLIYNLRPNLALPLQQPKH